MATPKYKATFSPTSSLKVELIGYSLRDPIEVSSQSSSILFTNLFEVSEIILYLYFPVDIRHKPLSGVMVRVFALKAESAQ